MPTLTLDIALFGVFLAVNLIIGLKYCGKRQTFKEYAMGDKQFSTATLTYFLFRSDYVMLRNRLTDLHDYLHPRYYLTRRIPGY